MQQGTRTNRSPLPGFMGLFGDHERMRRVFEIIRRVGPSDVPVLVTGESGTGKELVSRALHALSARASRSFVPVHCGAIPEELLESELFGHVKGAFTGAIASRTGRFQLAHQGTVFLDEIGEMSPRFQVKLLRVLEDGSFDPVGSASSRFTDVRVVAATHRDLHTAAREGSFREDLLYRLDVVRIHLPALRERRSDIPVIAQHVLQQVAARAGKEAAELTGEAARALAAYDWPGNVRELRNVLERAVLLCEKPGILQLGDLPAPVGCSPDSGPTRSAERLAAPATAGKPWDFGPEGTDFYSELETFEKRMISRALQLSGGSKREAARLLQVNRTTLLEKLKRKGWQIGAPPQETGDARGPKPVGCDRSPVLVPKLPPAEFALPVPPMTWAGALEGWFDMRRPVARATYGNAAPEAPARRAGELR